MYEQFRCCFMSQNRAVVENKRVLSIIVLVIPKAMLTSLRAPMELTENNIRALIPMNGGARDCGGESRDGGGARDAGSG